MILRISAGKLVYLCSLCMRNASTIFSTVSHQQDLLTVDQKTHALCHNSHLLCHSLVLCTCIVSLKSADLSAENEPQQCVPGRYNKSQRGVENGLCCASEQDWTPAYSTLDEPVVSIAK